MAEEKKEQNDKSTSTEVKMEAMKKTEVKEEAKKEPVKEESKSTKQEVKEADTEKEKPKEEIILKRSYVIPLTKAYEKPKTIRNKRAMDIIRAFAARHMKTNEENVKIGVKISELVNAKGVRKPPKKIKVALSKSKDGVVKCELE
ncbi:MAG: 60S ribosomal protein L31 [Candidatus Marsarchaeota archaeon]|nr:60S ribosomal protein L31 [Candidatus Marsarchaeota archaeon]